MLHPFAATVLGAVEGLTEFLPVSSTGHLILTSHLLGLRGEAIKTFEVVIQSGALAAVAGLYRAQVVSMWRGLLGHEPEGRALLLKLLRSFLPAAVVGLLLRRTIKDHLFSLWPVVAALAAGGLVMVTLSRWMRDHPVSPKTISSMTSRDAWLIGVAQCLSLWPGSSRAMVTIVAALLLGLPATMAAEYSFLLAMPTLGAATVFDAVKGGRLLVEDIGWLSLLCGFVVSAAVAAAAVRGFLRFLTRTGLAPFGWYRLGVAAIIWMVVGPTGG